MFTGIVQAVGRVAARETRGDGVRLEIDGAPFADRLEMGASVALAGLCATVVERAGDGFAVDLMAATLARTTAAGWRVGDAVNLEPSLRVGDELGGHMVTGHVDGVGEVAAVSWGGASGALDVALPEGLGAESAPRGSLAIDGVSLTVADLDGDLARFAIIPHTWNHTTLGKLVPGARVNVEADLIGKYVTRAVRAWEPGRWTP